MAQFVTRIDDELATSVDALVAAGAVASRSDAVRYGLQALVDHHRRRRTADSIVEGYRAQPQREDESGWSDEATIRMITDEPW